VAVPSTTLRSNLERLSGSLGGGDSSVLSATKGIEPESCLRMSEVIAEAGIAKERILAISGPNFAAEIAAGKPAATVVAGEPGRARQAQALLNGPAFRVYTSDDVAGVELGGALKNVLAIACGLADGLGYGENAKAALITRGLAEISRLGVAAGARPMTFLGLAGIGDLVLSCESDLSRNRRLGLALAEGKDLVGAIEAIGVVEGAVTAKAVPRLAQRLGVEMPICESLHAVLYEGKSPQEAGRDLMARSARPEPD
jgi:glycerol-3-phosphate dehydrogenase (NAD(P)+)